MKRLIVFLPALLWGILYGLIAMISGFESLKIWVWILVALMFLAGVFLFARKWWGCLLGVIPGVVFVVMGQFETGQLINEMPIGVALIVFYLVCGLLTVINNHHRPNNNKTSA